MSLTPEEQATKETYDKSAESWSTNHDTGGFWADEMSDFKSFLPEGRILEIGAGGGRDAKELIEAGYDYVGSDISTGLLEVARENNPGVNFDEVSVYDLNYDELFDGFWCSAVLLHIPRERIDDALTSINKNMKRGAFGFIAIKEGAGERMESDDKSTQDNERLFVYWSDEDFSDHLSKSGYEIVKRGYKPMSEKTKWLTYIVKTTENETGH